MKKVILILSAVVLSMNAPAQWIKCHSFKTSVTHCLSYNSKTKTLFAGKSDGLFVSLNGGTTWIEKKVAGAGSLPVSALSCIGSRLIVSNQNGILYSGDDGDTWHTGLAYPINYAKKLQFDTIQKKLFAGFSNVGGLYSSNDTAATWHYIRVPDGYPIKAFLAKDSLLILSYLKSYGFPPNPQDEYALIQRSANYGSTYRCVDSLYLVDLVMTDSVMIGVDNRNLLCESFDDGLTWETDMPLPVNGVSSIYSSGSRLVFLGGWNGEIYSSKDKADKWEAITDDFQGVANEFLQVGDTLYVASDSTIWKRRIAFPEGVDAGLSHQEHFTVFPNPTRGEFTVKFPELPGNIRNLSVSVYDNLGMKIHNFEVDYSRTDVQISLTDQPSGIYLIELWMNGRCFTGKIILER